MYTILLESDHGKQLKGFRNLQWRSSNTSSTTLTETFWIIRTNFRLHKFIMYLQMKRFFGPMEINEQRLLYDAPGVLTDDLFIELLKAQQFDVQQETLLQRLQFLQRWLQRPEWSLNLFYTYENCVRYEVMEIRRSVRKVKKFSGYVKSPSSVGTKSSKIVRLDPETFEWTSTEELDFFGFLTVGKVSGSSLELQLP